MTSSIFKVLSQYMLMTNLTLIERAPLFPSPLIPSSLLKPVSKKKSVVTSFFQFIYNLQPSSLHISSAYTWKTFNYCSFSFFFRKVKPIKSISIPDHILHGFESELHWSYLRRVRWEINCFYIEDPHCSLGEFGMVDGCIINEIF